MGIAGVDCWKIAEGKLVLVPAEDRLAAIARDHKGAMAGGLFYRETEGFETMISRLAIAQTKINGALNFK